MHNLRFCTSCNFYKFSVQIAACTVSLYQLQLVLFGACTSCNFYKAYFFDDIYSAASPRSYLLQKVVLPVLIHTVGAPVSERVLNADYKTHTERQLMQRLPSSPLSPL